MLGYQESLGQKCDGGLPGVLACAASGMSARVGAARGMDSRR